MNFSKLEYNVRRICMKKFLGIIFVMFLLSNPVYAADWEWIADDGNASLFLDKESIQVEPGSRDLPIMLIDCWVRREFMEPLDDGTKGDMVEFGFKVINDVNNAYMSIRAVLSYDSDGNTTSSKYSEGDKWDRFPPSSLGGSVYQKVIECIGNRTK